MITELYNLLVAYKDVFYIFFIVVFFTGFGMELYKRHIEKREIKKRGVIDGRVR